jgi:hypothetical protein
MNNVLQNLSELGRRLKTSPDLENEIVTTGEKNPWFVADFVRTALDAVMHEMLDEEKLKQWLSRYELKAVKKTVGLVMAGNVPLVGFHDFLCCYVAGCSMKVKLSGKDDELFPFIINMLAEIDPGLRDRYEAVEKLQDFDCVIATGSDNTNRSFEYYFRNYPKILRKNRNSVAILTGEETAAELEKLADDIFLYFGFGCRNVSKLYVPAGYDFTTLFPYFEKYKWLHMHGKYMNNYDYNRTVLLLNKTAHLANEFVMLVENPAIASPISTVHFEYWKDIETLKVRLRENAAKIQCVVANKPEIWEMPSVVRFGQSQHPELWDYADGVDTMEFLLGLSELWFSRD